MLLILYNFVEKAYACDLGMYGVVSQLNKCENPVFKLFVNFSCLKDFCLYGIIPLVLFCYVNIAVSVIINYCIILLWGYLWLDLLKGSYTSSDCAT